jgi:hypothetical protein
VGIDSPESAYLMTELGILRNRPQGDRK